MAYTIYSYFSHNDFYKTRLLWDNPFYQITKKQIKPIVAPLGFRCRNRFFYRIINNVVQQFCLLWLQRNYTIRFHISNVYNDNENGFLIEGDEIDRLIGNGQHWLGAQYYRRGNELVRDPLYTDLTAETYQKGANDCNYALNKYLLPWFSRVSTCESAYNALKEFSYYHLKDKQPGGYEEIGFLLEMGKYKKVSEILNYFIQNKNKFNTLWWQEKSSEIQKLYAAIKDNDQVYISGYMDQKMKLTMSEYKWKTKNDRL